jgi:hypothetical protein
MSAQASHETKRSTPGSFAEALRLASISSIAVIDDVFDDPTVEELTHDVVRSLAQELAEKEAFHCQGQSMGLDFGAAELTNVELAILWKICITDQTQPGGNTPLRTFLATHLAFEERLKRHAAVAGLCDTLRLGEFSVTALGASTPIPQSPIQLVFLDYVLSPIAARSGGAVEQAAIEKLRDLYQQDVKPPYVILISDQPTIPIDKRTELCRKVGTLGGFFGFIQKNDLRNETMLLLKLAELGLSSETSGHQEIRSFAKAIVDSMNSVAVELNDFVYRLELQDYVHLQHQRLSREGEPLGGYVQWLVGAKLGHLFAADRGVTEARLALNKLSYSALLPSAREPSAALCQAFFCALTEPVDGMPARPARLGDVYVNDNKAKLVVSPECDLFVGCEGTSRQPDSAMPVFVVDGTVDDRHAYFAEAKANSTECFLVDDKICSIAWDVKGGVRTIDYGKLVETLSQEGYRFRAQLRPLFAIAIQRQCADRLCRVGIPVAPPVWFAANVHLYVGKVSDELTELGAPIKHTAQLRYEEKKAFARLTIEGISEIRKLVEKLLEDRKSSENGEAASWFTDHAKDIRDVLANSKVWLELSTQFTKRMQGQLAHRRPDLIIGHPKDLPKVEPINGAFVIAIQRDETDPGDFDSKLVKIGPTEDGSSP